MILYEVVTPKYRDGTAELIFASLETLAVPVLTSGFWTEIGILRSGSTVTLSSKSFLASHKQPTHILYRSRGFFAAKVNAEYAQADVVWWAIEAYRRDAVPRASWV